jgi:N-methylhydantoinase B
MSERRDGAVDPVTYEVVKHKLWAMVDEQAIALKSVSGSSVITEANDFNVGLYTRDGDAIAVGRFIFTQARTITAVIKSVIREYVDNPGIHPGDMFICNDPWMGSLHPPDVSIVAPIFYEEELVAWSGSCAHQLDMGGMNFGSWASQATERQQEAMILSGIKFVEGGEVRNDIWKSILTMSRLPFLVGLDFRAMIATNNVGRRRFTSIVERYGLPTVELVVRQLLDSSEASIRERLRRLRDGIYRSVDFLDHDGHEDRLYRVALSATKTGDTLELDFAGSSPQAPGFINCTESGLIAGVCAGLIPVLAHDIPFNEGLMRPIAAHAPPGTICNATSPAPSSMASVAAVYAVTSVVVSALSQLVLSDEDHGTEAQARTRGSFVVVNLAGRDQYEEPFGTMLLDGLAGGGGAFGHHDGVQTCGTFSMLEPNIANVETIENFAPILYLYRKLVPDSGGAGRFRGGLALGWAITPHDVPHLKAIVISHGVNVPNATGLSGGLPGSCTVNRVARDTDLLARWQEGALPSDIADLDGRLIDLGAKPGQFELEPGEVFETRAQGGGGWGDPLLRDREAVARDLIDGAISPHAAEHVYGVAQGNGKGDATDRLRDRLRKERLGGGDSDSGHGGGTGTEAVVPIGDRLSLMADGEVACSCGYSFGSGNWKESAIVRRANSMPPSGMRLRDEVELCFYLCPACGTQHGVDVTERDGSPMWDFEPR